MLSFLIICGYTGMAWVIVSSSLHEIGHLVALYSVGGKADRITAAFYGVGLSFRSKLTVCDEAVVLLSGPLVNLILWIIVGDTVNPLLFFLNLLPIFPLDGGRLFNLFIPQKIAKFVSNVFLILLLILSIYLLIYYKSFSMLLIAVYLIFSNKRYL